MGHSGAVSPCPSPSGKRRPKTSETTIQMKSNHGPNRRGSNPFRALLALAPALLAFLALPPETQATPNGDPICGAPSDFARLQELRAKLATARRHKGLSAAATPAAPTLALTWPAPGTPHLVIGGEAGRTYDLQSATDLGEADWSTWLSFAMGNQPMDWGQNILTDGPQRYFRVKAVDPEAIADSVSNFRLLDAQGASHDLYYRTDLAGTVVMAAGTDLAGVASLAPMWNQIAARYAGHFQYLILLSDPAPSRAAVIAKAQSLKLAGSVLLDVNGLAGRALGLKHVGEVAVVQPPVFTLAYRGQFAGPGQTTYDKTYLGQAVAGLETSTPISFKLTPGSGPALASTTETVPDYAKDVAPVLYKYCAICHRPGDVAPFALTNYTVAQTFAQTMKYMVMSGKMPPWHVDPQYGHWGNDLSLPGEAKSTLIRWIDAGAPRGTGNDPLAELPIQPSFNQWPPELGQPDALVSIPVQSIKESGTEDYRYVFVQSPNTSNVWLRAAIVLPTNYRAVHHYLVWPGQVGNSPFFGRSSYETSIAGYVPGFKPFQFPADAGVLLTNRNWLTFNLHYTPYGEATTDHPVMAMWYHKTPPAKKFQSVQIANLFFSIPPGAADFPVSASWTATKASRLYRLNPHMHLRGKRMSYELQYPNGTKELILSVPDYDFNWQTGYELSPPKDLPVGTKLVVSGAFDNSALNLSNPDPTISVGWGDQSWFEMFVGFIDIAQ